MNKPGFNSSASISEDHDPIEATVEQIVRNEVLELRTGTPGKITKYDPATGSATVQPAIQTMGSSDDAQPESLEPIAYVPVLHMGGGGFFQCFPLQSGDLVWLSTSDRSLSAWKAGDGSPVDPGVAITHSIGDSIALPGLAPLKHAPAIAHASDYVLGAVNASSALRFTPAGKATMIGTAGIDLDAGATGKIRIGNDAAELLDMFDDLLQLLLTATVITALGPQPLTNILPQLAELKVKLGLLKE